MKEMPDLCVGVNYLDSVTATLCLPFEPQLPCPVSMFSVEASVWQDCVDWAVDLWSVCCGFCGKRIGEN